MQCTPLKRSSGIDVPTNKLSAGHPTAIAAQTYYHTNAGNQESFEPGNQDQKRSGSWCEQCRRALDHRLPRHSTGADMLEKGTFAHSRRGLQPLRQCVQQTRCALATYLDVTYHSSIEAQAPFLLPLTFGCLPLAPRNEHVPLRHPGATSTHFQQRKGMKSHRRQITRISTTMIRTAIHDWIRIRQSSKTVDCISSDSSSRRPAQRFSPLGRVTPPPST
ncbi:hypothetical protein VTI28DRAFT_8977 [Corynascus sepedonium]